MFRTMNINQLIRIEQVNHYPHLRYPTLPPPPKKNHTKKEVKNYLPGILWTYLKSFLKVFEKNGRKNDQVNLHFICIVSHHWNTFFPLLLSQQCAICTISDKKNIVNNHITMEKTLLRNSIHRYLGAPRREKNLPLRTEADLLQPYNRVNAINYSYQ